jgi:hypothetical protein
MDSGTFLAMRCFFGDFVNAMVSKEIKTVSSHLTSLSFFA